MHADRSASSARVPAGSATAVRLLEAGHDDVVLLEKASGVGGTWWHNRYPGLSCDIPSHLYSFSFAPKLDWKRPYGGRDEIHAYMEDVVDRFELRDRIRFDTRSDEGGVGRRARRLARRHRRPATTFEFDVVVAGLGMFNELNWPDIAGLDSFGGTQFHSARWDWDHDLAGERVGVIGSAASAVQFIPEIAPARGHLTVFQRAANWVLPKEDTPWTEEQLEHFRTHPEEVEASRQAIFDRVDPLISFSNAEMLRLSTEAGLRNLEVGRGSRAAAPAHAHRSVRLPATADLERLLPDVQPAERRARHRADRAHHARRGSSRSTASSASSTR